MAKKKVPGLGRASLHFYIKVTVTFAILAVLLSHIDFRQSAQAMLNAAPGWLLLAFLSYFICLLISVAKWRKLLMAVGVYIPFLTLTKLYTIGIFAGAFPLGVLGGDMVRWHFASRDTSQRTHIAASILLERAIGVAVLFVLCAFLLPIFVPKSAFLLTLTLLIGMSICFALSLYLAFNRRLLTTITYVNRRNLARHILIPLYKLQKSLHNFSRQSISVASGYSILFYVTACLTFFFICQSFNSPLSVFESGAIQLVVNVLSLVPISVGSAGITQASDVYLLGSYGIQSTDALAISLMRLSFHYVFIIAGGVFLARQRRGMVAVNTSLRTTLHDKKVQSGAS